MTVSFTFNPLSNDIQRFWLLLAFPPRIRCCFQVSGKIDFSRARVSSRVSTVKGTSNNRFLVSIELEFLPDTGVFTILVYGIVNVSRRWKQEGLQIFLIIGFFRVGIGRGKYGIKTYWIRSIFLLYIRIEEREREKKKKLVNMAQIGVNSQ